MDILAMDLGQGKSVCCDYQRDGRRQEFVTIDTKPGALHDLIVERNPGLVVIEICPIAGWIRDLCEALGVKLIVANTSDEPWQWRKLKRKTDKDDALKLARLAAMEQIKPVHVPAPAIRQWRMLIHYRQTLVQSGTSIRNRIRAILQMVNVELPPTIPLVITTHALALSQIHCENIHAESPSKNTIGRSTRSAPATHMLAHDATVTREPRLHSFSADYFFAAARKARILAASFIPGWPGISTPLETSTAHGPVI
ncbi:MAG TPA: transposase [Phycisphaerae bacterium]|nr:transposase [Phycisphaerae bacterium]